MVDRGEVSWAALPAAEQKEMDQGVAMWTEAASQGHMDAQNFLADIHLTGQGVARDYVRAFELYNMAAQQGCVPCQYAVGCFYQVTVTKKPGFSVGFLARWVTNWVLLYDFCRPFTSYGYSDNPRVLICIPTAR